MNNKRNCIRADVKVPLELEVDIEGSKALYKALSCDLSFSGIGLICFVHPGCFSDPSLSIVSLGNFGQVNINAALKWGVEDSIKDKRYHCGLEFLSLASKEKNKLEDILALNSQINTAVDVFDKLKLTDVIQHDIHAFVSGSMKDFIQEVLSFENDLELDIISNDYACKNIQAMYKNIILRRNSIADKISDKKISSELNNIVDNIIGHWVSKSVILNKTLRDVYRNKKIKPN